MTDVTIRPLAQADHADWRRLWTDYLTFYESSVSEEIYALTWKRLPSCSGAPESACSVVRVTPGTSGR